MIKREIVEKIKGAVDIVDLIGEFVQLKKVGTRYRGLCPFHLEKRPSFYVDPDRQMYHCFGCGEGGTAISFLMKYEKMTFPEAVRFLAGRVGIPIVTENVVREEADIYEVMEFAANLFQNYLYYYPQPLKYLQRRGIGKEVQERFRLGYAPGNRSLLKEAKKKGISLGVLKKAGLIVERDGAEEDFFFARLVFPIFSIAGKIIGFGGRALEEGVEPKYLNSPETEVFKKGENLYGFYQAKRRLRDEKPILVEGYFDLLSLAEVGINTGLAPLGTAFTLSQAMLVRRYNKDLYISFDGDTQGREAAKKASITALRVGLAPMIVLLPDGYDPDKFIREKGKEAYLALLAQALDLIDFYLWERDLTKIRERREIVNQLQAVIPEIGDVVLRDLYVEKACRVLKIRPEIFQERQPEREGEKKTEMSSTKKEERLLAFILLSPEYARLCRTELPASAFSPDFRPIVNLIYKICDQDFTSAGVCDLLFEEKEKKIVASLAFQEKILPDRKDFLFLLKRVKADFLKKEIKEKTDEEKLKAFLEVKRSLLGKRGVENATN